MSGRATRVCIGARGPRRIRRNGFNLVASMAKGVRGEGRRRRCVSGGLVFWNPEVCTNRHRSLCFLRVLDVAEGWDLVGLHARREVDVITLP